MFDNINEIVIIELEVVFTRDGGLHVVLVPWEVSSIHV